nr:hypothetical protein [Tanacetum cinerariifolium]
MQVTRCIRSVNLETRLLNGVNPVSWRDLSTIFTSWVASLLSGGGRPSGMVSKRNEEKLLRVSDPWDLTRHWCLSSLLTKVIRKPWHGESEQVLASD